MQFSDVYIKCIWKFKYYTYFYIEFKNWVKKDLLIFYFVNDGNVDYFIALFYGKYAKKLIRIRYKRITNSCRNEDFFGFAV